MFKNLPSFNGAPHQEGIQQLTPVTLENIVNEATRLGRVEMKQDSGLWVTEIMFRRPSGSFIFAKGTNRDLVFSVNAAIVEARELGAVEAKEGCL